MQRPIRPRWLLRQAEELAGEGRGQPRNADLRRAVSAAYYATFHAITLETSRLTLPDASDEEQRRAVRLISHASVRQVSKYVGGDQPPEHMELTITRLRESRPVSQVAADFVALNEARAEADYDHFAELTRPGTLALVARSHQAVSSLFDGGRAGEFNSYLGLIALRVR